VASGLYLDDEQDVDDPRRAAVGPEPDRDGWQPGAAGTSHPGAGDEPERSPQRGGRNLPAAIGVGLGMGAVVLASLFLWRPSFLGVVAVAIGVAVWELVRAVRTTGVEPPLVPLIAGGTLTTGLAWWGGGDGLTFGLIITIVAVMVWRFAHGVRGYGRDVTMAALIAVYVPFLGGFAAMLASAHDGQLRVLATLIAVVLSDTGGYIVGAKFGRHPMAPSVSPKKSWEGLVGSLLAAATGSAVVLFLMFHVSLWWGLLFGLAIAVASVIGDLGESMLKRDMGVKDMSGLLPGHGGLMDRLDSIVFAAPVGFLLLAAIAPVTG
jgi:phosphatidate cytidylyltransferase